MGGSFGQQLKAFLRRNLLLKRRRVPSTCVEFIGPLVIAAFVAVASSSISRISYPAVPEYDANTLFQSRFYPTPTKTLMVVPNNAAVKSIMDYVVSDLPVTAAKKYEMFANETAMLDAFRASPSTYSIGVMFADDPMVNGTYQIRVPFEQQANVKTTIDYTGQANCRNSDGLGGTCPPNTGYLYSGFASLQVAVDNAMIKVKTSNTGFQLPSILVKLMPKEAYSVPPYSVQFAVCAVAAIMFVSFYAPLVNLLVTEKEKNIRDSLNMTGMNRTAFWLAWTVIYWLMGIVVAAGVTGIFRAGSVFITSNFGLVFFINLLYLYAGFMFAVMMSTFFQSTKVSSIAFFVIFLLLGMLYFVCKIPALGGLREELHPAVFWVLSLFPQVAYCLALDQLIFVEWAYAKEGATFSNAGYTAFQQNFSIQAAMVMLLVDIILYALLLGYFDNVVPGVFGKRKSPLFCFKKSYWNPPESEHKDFSHLLEGTKKIEDIESVPNDLVGKESIKIFNVRKTYNTGKKKKNEEKSKGRCIPVYENETINAVDSVSLDIYEGMITAILGHNGAGKSTLFGIMSGLIQPSYGTATIYGKDVCTDGDLYQIQHMLGVCPQQDVLYDDLSVQEHLELFANIRGVQNVDAEVERVVSLVDLSSQLHTFSSELSGGQKRKLSVGLAMIGDPKVIFLDEPTAGMDPYSRRKMWTLLKTIKYNKTILLTTHFMDEADILADRKAIVNKGKLQCYGSSMFLKNRFGIGYRLNMVTEENISAEAVTSFVTQCIPDASMIRQHGMELSYTLPMKDADKFASLFQELEQEQANDNGLGIKNYGVSMPTLEEVFLRLAETNEVQELNKELPADDMQIDQILSKEDMRTATTETRADRHLLNVEEEDTTNGHVKVTLRQPPQNIVKSGDFKKNQFQAIIWMRAQMLRRAWYVLVFRWIFPIAIGLGGVLILGLQPNEQKYEIPIANDFVKSWIAYFSSETPLLYLNSAAASLTKLVNNFNSSGYVWSNEMTSSQTLAAMRPHHGAFNFTSVDLTSFATSPAFTLYYNDTALHSLPLQLNIWANAWYRAYSSDASWMINVTSRSLPKINPTIEFSGRVFNGIRLIGLAFCMFSGQFGFEVSEDRASKCRSQLKVAGVTVRMYWATTLFVHGIQCLGGLLICTVLLFVVNIVEFRGVSPVILIIILIILYVPVNLLFCYVQTFAFKSPETVGSVQGWGVSLYGVLPYLVVSFIDAESYVAMVALHYLFCILIPPYLIIGGMHFIVRVYTSALIKGEVDQIQQLDYWRFENHVTGTVIISIFHLIFLSLLLVILDVRSTGGKVRDVFFPKERKKSVLVSPYESNQAFDSSPELILAEEVEDSDVTDERRLVASMCSGKVSQENTAILVNGLRKEFSKRSGDLCNCCQPSVDKIKVAVDNLTFHVQTGEVFGLLGHNGAGKTTALNAITAEVVPDKGQVVVGGYDVSSNLSEAFHELGCCPQHDQLWQRLTLEEHLKGYALINGVPKSDIDQVIDYYLENLQIEEHRKKLTKELSGGTKRKLSYAISMIGMPKAVLLDEPSTGMDPASKRFLWDTVIKGFSGTDRGAILTTHSMEEADALCTRVGIMVAGTLKCLGPTQHLKTKFGGGYTLEVKLRQTQEDDADDQLEALNDYVKAIFPQVVILEQFGDRVQYKVPSDNVKALSVVFSAVESAKDRLKIEEYSFSQSTLEQVFIQFAKQEYEAVESVRKGSINV